MEEGEQCVPWIFPTVSTDVATAHESELIIEMPKPIEDLELTQLKQSLLYQIDLMENINNKYEQILKEIDEELLQQVVSLIKKITQKVIHKQIEQDDTVMLHMIKSALKQIDKKQKYELFLCPEDYNQLSTANIPSFNTLHPDPALKKGDFRITIPTGELISIMEEKLHAFWGV